MKTKIIKHNSKQEFDLENGQTIEVILEENGLAACRISFINGNLIVNFVTSNNKSMNYLEAHKQDYSGDRRAVMHLEVDLDNGKHGQKDVFVAGSEEMIEELLYQVFKKDGVLGDIFFQAFARVQIEKNGGEGFVMTAPVSAEKIKPPPIKHESVN
jgi:hypothetical protein